jgi:hypothetical protein
MLERLQNHVVFIYRKQDILISSGEVTWNVARRIEHFSTDMSDFSYFNYCFTPDLMLYMDYSKADNKYMIKKSLDQTVLIEIPEGFFNPKANDPLKMGKRFMFTSNNTFKLVSDDCLEKVYDFTDILAPPKPIAYCRVPMLNINKYDKESSSAHFYSEPLFNYSDNIVEKL